MKKIYEKPNAKYVSLIAQEDISSSFEEEEKDVIYGETGVESSIFNN